MLFFLILVDRTAITITIQNRLRKKQQSKRKKINKENNKKKVKSLNQL